MVFAAYLFLESVIPDEFVSDKVPELSIKSSD